MRTTVHIQLYHKMQALCHFYRRKKKIFSINIFNINYKDVQKNSTEHIIKAVVDSSRHMARRRIGALIVLENNTGLDEYVESGITVNAEVTNELIINIFIPNTPLHDGAMIIDENKIRAASCVLPLSDNRSIASSYGTRHRAALGLSEVTDAIVIAVSEETGKISVCQNGVLTSDFSTEDLTKYLAKNWKQQDKIIK